ncbi:MAG: hypothetical protein AAB320_09135 [Elusimicrobiota bacterium]
MGLSLALALAAALPLAAQSLPEGVHRPPVGLSSSASAKAARAEEHIQMTPLGRRLLAQTQETPRRASAELAAGRCVRFVHGAPSLLAFEPDLWAAASDLDAELALLHELARADADLPLDMPEGEMAAGQRVMEHALARASADASFDAALRRAYRAIPRDRREDAPGLSRLGQDLAAFSRSPEEYYWSVEQGRAAGSVRLVELEDFMERRALDLSSAALGPGGRYARVGGRRYPPALLAAARRLLETGGLTRIREALGPFETAHAAELKSRLAAWASRP